jgi:pyridoxal phosphate enzyme (YggS family)
VGLPQTDIKANLETVQKRIARACQRAGRSPDEITLIAVTKTVKPIEIETAFNLGIRNFGENRIQEAGEKIKVLNHLLPGPVWHMIGHLQSNKVKAALDLFDVIQSVDSLGMAEAINQRAQGKIEKIPVLLQINIAAETTKSGFSLNEVESSFPTILRMARIEVRGLMTIAPLVENPEQVRPVFRRLRELRDSFDLQHLSMGMTDDFEVAVEEGATMIRIGRAIFGERR